MQNDHESIAKVDLELGRGDGIQALALGLPIRFSASALMEVSYWSNDRVRLIPTGSR